MKTAIFDLESDGFIKDMKNIWTIVVKDMSNGETTIHHDAHLAIDHLDQFDMIVGHNCIMFDIPALHKITGRRPKARVYDTCVISRLLWPDRLAHPAGGSSLKNWGKFLNMPKGEFSDFSKWSQYMDTYCVQDVNITAAVLEYLNKFAGACPIAVQLEHDTCRIITKQIYNGFGFDTKNAQCLLAELVMAQGELTAKLQEVFPPKLIPMRTKVKEIPFNPGSRDMIASNLIKKYKWKPTEFTETGKPKIDETILAELSKKWYECAMLNNYLLIEKRIGQLNQWLEYDQQGCIHGGVNTGGTISGRMSHSEPNMAQVPRCVSPFGYECRSLFGPTQQGWVQVGADASGLELRMLAHYLAEYDNGDYAKIVCDGDIHSHNQKMAGLTTRDQAKTFIYGLLYGAGNEKIGKIIEGTSADGGRLKDSFKKQVPAYQKLLNQLEFVVAKRGFLKGLDGRPLPVRSAHAALNLLLQSAGAVVMKKAVCILDSNLHLKYPGQYAFMANIHDEWQIECKRSIADDVGTMACNSITEAGIGFSMRCPLKGEYKIGNNWAETH